jgi:PAS domain S-box-containing protein
MTDLLSQQPTNPMLPANEPERLAALHRYQVLDTPAEAAFDRITTLAARIFKISTVLISLVDESRAWFKSSIGFGAPEVPRDATICSFAVLTDEPLIVPDTRLDDRFACNPFVQCEPGMRFYAGAPLIDRHGFNLGTLCLLDSVPRDPLTAEQQATLVDLAAMVVDELELRLAAQRIAQVDAALVEITQGVARVTGGAFFDELVRHFAKVLGTDYVYIGLVEGHEPKMMRTIATCDRGNIVENLEYRLQDTPCWDAIEQRKICCYPRNVQAQFPNAPLFKPLAVESYIAIPFYGSNGQVLGLLGVMDGNPLTNVHLAESLLTIFATRIATELERQQHELMLVEQTRLLEAISTGQPLDECLSALCSSIAKLSPSTRACVLLTDVRRLKFSHSITPDFPPSLSIGLKDAPIGELAIGTCGQAVYCGEPVTCNDIATDDRWSQKWRDLSIAHGIRACYSVPIVGIDNFPLGSLMLCFSEARLPTEWEYRLGEFGTKIASITIERKRSIENLSESEERLNLALAAADMATWDTDLSTGETIWSAQHFQILGYDPATVDTPTVEMWLNRVHPDDRAAVMQARATAQRERSLYRIEYRLVRADTEAVVWVSTAGRFLANQAGEAMRLVGVMFDITDRKVAELENQQLTRDLAARTDELQTILDALPVGVAIADDPQCNVIRSNQFTQNMLAVSPDTNVSATGAEAETLPFRQYRDGQEIPGDRLPMQLATAQGQAVRDVEIQMVRTDGAVFDWLVNAVPLFDDRQAVRGCVAAIMDITELRQAEAAILRHQERLAFVLNTTGVGLWLNSLPLGVLNWDDRTRELFFVSPDVEPTIELFWSRVHPDDREPTRLAVETALRDRTLYEIDHRAVHPDTGEIRWIRSAGKATYAPDGEPISFDGINYDITDRKQAEEEFRQSQALAQRQLMEIEAIYQTAPIGLTILDPDLRYERINHRLAEINGISTEDHIGRTVRDIVPTLADENEPLLQSVLTTGEPLLNIEISGETQAQPGVYRTWIENCYPLKDETGRSIGINVVVQEITERKRAEAAIQESKAQLEFLLEAAEFGDWDLNIIDRTAHRSLRHDRIFGYESLLPHWTYEMFLDHILPEDRAEADRKYQNAIDTNEPWDFECRIRRADLQVRWIWVSGYVYHNAQGVASRMLGLVADITDRKLAQAALAERNNELDSFVHTVSHDLKAPLRAISNLSVWIEEDLEGQLPPDNQQQFQLLRARVKRMESMVDNLLLYARSGRQEAHLETFNLTELLSEIIDSIAPPESFRIEIEPPLPTLTTKRLFLSQVFANLISNAVKHHTSVMGNLHISAIEHPDCHEFIIKDDGPGIAPEHHEQVFAIFQTLKGKDNSDSTGIGLAIVKKIVETEAGTIRLESRLGQGTTFYVTWPKSHQQAELA